MFCQFAPDFQRVLTPNQWAEVSKRFFRGQFDAELTEEVSHKDPNLTVASFRFLQMFGAKLTAANPSSQQAARDEAMAVKEHEQADVNLAGRKLKSEVAKWTTYNESVEMWRSKTELQKRVLLTGRDQKNQKLINDECDRCMPVRDVQCPESQFQVSVSSFSFKCQFQVSRVSFKFQLQASV